jgi:hypothetical protein
MANSPIATGAGTRLSLVREQTFGVIPPNPAFKVVRPASLNLENKPKYIRSKEIRSDYRKAGQILVGKDVSASYETELSLDSHDDLIESALRTTRAATPEIVKTAAELAAVAGAGVFNTAAGLGAPFLVGHLVKASGYALAANNGVSRATATGPNAVTLGGLATAAEAVPPVGARLKVVGLRAAANGSVSATLAGNKITVATTNPATLGIAPGTWFRASGFTGVVANNGWYRCASITGAGPWDINCDIVPTGFNTDAAAGQIVSLFYSDYFRDGSTRTSYAGEQAHLDIGKFKYSAGLLVRQTDIKLSAEAIIDMTFEFDGVTGDWQNQVAGATYAPKTTNDPFNTSSNIGACYVNGAWVQGTVTGASISIMSAPVVDKALGSFGAADIHYGGFSVEGSLEKFFLDTIVAQLVMAGSATGVVIPVFDPLTGSGYLFDIRRVKLMDGNNPTVSNPDDALKEPYKFTAEPDATLGGVVIHIQKIESYA